MVRCMLSPSRVGDDLVALASQYLADLPPRPPNLDRLRYGRWIVLVTGTTGNLGCDLLESLITDGDVDTVNRG